MSIKTEIRLPLSWGWVERTRVEVAQALAGFEEQLREAAVMTASELAENVVKHGEASTEGGWVRLEVEGSRLRISSTNGVREPARAAIVTEIIRMLAEAKDPHALYLERMGELLEQPSGPTQLGLYRIVFEGGFQLSASYQQSVLNIVAEREV
jgi:hypothetical protein